MVVHVTRGRGLECFYLLALRRVPRQQPAFNGGDAAAADAEMKAQELRELTALGFPEQQARVCAFLRG